MITLNFENLSQIDNKHGLTKEEIAASGGKIAEYLEKIEARDQGFYKILDDAAPLEQVESFAQKVEGKFKDVVILGIGGSALGPICIQQSLTHLFGANKAGIPKLHVLDNIDPALITELEDVVELATTLFIVITKSGTTPETISQYLYFREKYQQAGLSIPEHFVFITDPEKGFLREVAREENITTFDIPENVGGRFSVLTPVGLLPARLLGLDIRKMIEGAKKIRDRFLSPDFEKNLPFQLANIQYLLDKKGKPLNIIMPYAQKLIRLADWYRQLLAESIGKKFDNEGNVVFTGLTPINALGVTDQHSQSQLYNEGPNDKLIMFIEVERLGPDLKIPKAHDKPELDFLDKGITFNQLLTIEKEATAGSLTKNDRPNLTIKVDSLTEETLGELFMLFEASIAFLGELYNINAFDQPGVELSKKLTKEALIS